LLSKRLVRLRCLRRLPRGDFHSIAAIDAVQHALPAITTSTVAEACGKVAVTVAFAARIHGLAAPGACPSFVALAEALVALAMPRAARERALAEAAVHTSI